jgi:hypothetical protein
MGYLIASGSFYAVKLVEKDLTRQNRQIYYFAYFGCCVPSHLLYTSFWVPMCALAFSTALKTITRAILALLDSPSYKYMARNAKFKIQGVSGFRKCPFLIVFFSFGRSGNHHMGYLNSMGTESRREYCTTNLKIDSCNRQLCVEGLRKSV